MTIRSPNRVSHRALLTLKAPAEAVFPLLCPVAESRWVQGWAPSLVLSHSGQVERDCVFVTGSAPEDSTWIVSRHDPVGFQLEMFKFTPNHSVGRLEISVSAAQTHTAVSTMSVTTTYTSLGNRGNGFVQDFTEPRYLESMHHWESALNHYLATGEKLA